MSIGGGRNLLKIVSINSVEAAGLATVVLISVFSLY